MAENILLIGFKACGKSTLGAGLAKLLGRNFVDSDSLVEELAHAQYGKKLSCRELYNSYGRNEMRRLESEALRALQDRSDSVVATGGGILLEKQNRALLRSAGRCVYLDVALPVLEKRLQDQLDSPLFQKKSVAELHAERAPLYEAHADLVLKVRDEDDEEQSLRALYTLLGEEKYGH